jgi:hypothetical protein
MKELVNHTDRLGQPIGVGDYVAFTWASFRGVRVGKILKLTKQRVRIIFNNSYVSNGIKTEYVSYHITRPQDCLVLGDTLPQHLTMATLQRKI